MVCKPVKHRAYQPRDITLHASRTQEAGPGLFVSRSRETALRARCLCLRAIVHST
jgi:hypothetical protein